MASDYKIVEPSFANAGPASVTGTKQALPLGFVARGVDIQTGSAGLGGARFVYCVGSNSDAARGCVVVIDAGTARGVDTNSTGSCWQMGVAAGNLTATNIYGWVQIAGVADYVKVGGTDAIAAGASIGIGATAGRFETVAAGYRIFGANNVVSISDATAAALSDAATVRLYRPQHIGVTANL